MRRPTYMTPDRSISLVIAASLPASISDANRLQASRRRSSGHITESTPMSDTDRRMNGATVAPPQLDVGTARLRVSLARDLLVQHRYWSCCCARNDGRNDAR